MKTERYPDGKVNAGDRVGRWVGSVEEHEFALVAGLVPDEAQRPALVFAGCRAGLSTLLPMRRFHSISAQ